VVSGAPTDAGYTAAFLVSAGVALAAGIVSALIPRAPQAKGEPVAVNA
jgi:hypothetical protein